MRITRQQLRRIIREAIEGEGQDGYMVPRFETSEDAMLFMDELDPRDTVMQDVVDPQTGEVYVEAGETPISAGWVEDPDAPKETDPDKLDHYDWDDWEEEGEDEDEDREQAYEDMLSSARELATLGGSDWARDTLFDAHNNPSMWQGQYKSAEEYVKSYGQSVAADMSMSIEYMIEDDQHMEVYRSLPEQQPNSFVGQAFLPSKQIFKDIIADYFYDGIEQGVDAVAHKYADVEDIQEAAEASGNTEKYNDDSALRGDQSKLPDALQKGIIDKTVEDRDEREEKEREEKNEGTSLEDMPDSWRQILAGCLE